MTPEIGLAIAGGVAQVVMQSAPVNSISEPWLAAFHSVLDEVEATDGLAVLHLRSALRVFAAGGDLVEMRARMAADDPVALMRNRLARIHALFDRIERLPLVVFCEIGGDALGGGLELALACDLRMAADHVRLGCPEIRLGLFPAAGGSQRLTGLCGRSVAARMIYTGDRYDAETARQMGLIDWCVPAEVLRHEADNRVAQIASHPPEALRAAKRSIAAWGGPDGFAVERELGSALISSPQTRWRVDAFMEKRYRT